MTVFVLTGRMPVGAYVQLITALILFFLLLGAAYFATKWIASVQQAKSVTANIEVIETYRLSPTRFIAIIRLGRKYVACAVSKDTLSPITELDEGDLILHEKGDAKSTNFQEVLQDLLKKGKNGNSSDREDP